MQRTREEVLARILAHMEMMRRDLGDLHQIARQWSPSSKSYQHVRQVEKDFQMFEAHARAMLSEIDHQMANQRHFTGANITTTSVPLQSRSNGAPPQTQENTSPPELPMAEGSAPEEPAPSSPSSDSRLAKLATDLPASVLEELKKSGLT